MASAYWIKLYHEVLDDPKMGQLPDRIWRRAIELFLMAGERDAGGELPPTKDIAWRLRCSVPELRLDLTELQSAGIVSAVEDGWIVTNFSKRQAPISSAERQRRYRERHRTGDKDNGVDVTKRNVTRNDNSNDAMRLDIDIDKEEDIDKEGEDDHGNQESFQPYIRQFLAILGRKRFNNKAQHNAALDLLEKYPADFMDAARWAADQGMDLGKALTSMRTALPKWHSSSDKAAQKAKAAKLPKHPPSPNPVYEPGPLDPLAVTWAPILAELKGQMAQGTFETQLKNAVLLSVDDPVRIGLQTQMACDWVGLRLNRVMRDTLRRHLQREVDVQYEVIV